MTTEERIDAALAAAKKRILSDLPVQETERLYEEMKYNAALRIRSKRKWGCRPPK